MKRWQVIPWIVVVLFLGPILARFYGNLLWFTSVGYEQVFLRIFYFRVGLFLVAGILSFLLVYGTYVWTRTTLKEERNPFIIGGIATFSLFSGLAYTTSWGTVLRFLNRVDFNVTDAFFGNDISFYVFTLDFLHLAINFLFFPLLVAFLLSAALIFKKYGLRTYNLAEGPVTKVDFKVLFNHARIPATLLGVLVILLAGKLFLGRYDLLFSQYGTVFGIGYAQAHVLLPALSILAAGCLVGGIALLIKSTKKLLFSVVTILLLMTALGYIGTFLIQNVSVEPDEYNKEAPYLKNEIAATNKAYALDRIEEQQFPIEDNLTWNQVQQNPETIDNIRLWDWRPLLKTYNELQIFRTYYTFTDVDVDRYTIDGEDREVMLSAREINTNALPSRSWINDHLVYTHGFGVAMSPVKEVSPEGLPVFLIKDIPPQSMHINITQPRIYYGENTNVYAVVNTETQELDYPSGDNNVYTTYAGSGGVAIDSFMDRAVMAILFGAPQILFSSSITDESRILFHRDIHDRVRTIAPFLSFDSDPYIVVAEGKLYWIYDAYTTTEKYPYSRMIRFKGEPINYIRNSVKIVVDAYNGDTTFYVADDEPLVRTYAGIFPGLFKELNEMPAELREHIRYPEDLFRAQAYMYLDYHMKDTQVFYNKEDQWRIPNEILRGAQQPMEPYYIIMKLPGNNESEFVQILPFIPRGKENMIGWMAARSDPPNYGRLQAFQFSKQELIFGPMQIESRIDQNTDISQLITLWSQAGSSVLRGNLLAIPIEESILFVEPLYLQSTGGGSLPELKRVIVAQGDRLTMQPTLQEALLDLYGREVSEQPVAVQDLSHLQNLYEEAHQALREGDFETYAARITMLGEELNASVSE